MTTTRQQIYGLDYLPLGRHMPTETTSAYISLAPSVMKKNLTSHPIEFTATKSHDPEIMDYISQWRGADIPVMTLWGRGSFVYRLSECLERCVAIPGKAEMSYSALLTFVPEGVETATLPEFEEMS